MLYDEVPFRRPSPPPRRRGHLWLGVFLSGLALGLGAFYMREIRPAAAAAQRVVIDINPRQWQAALNPQIQTLLADIKGLMAELRQTQHALAEAQIRIAALERENALLRYSATPMASAPERPPEVRQEPDGLGGPLVHAPPEPAPQNTTAAPGLGKGPKACWMRGGTMIATYRIAIRDDGFEVSPAWEDDGTNAWPDEFGPLMEGFSGTPAAGATVSRAEFKKIMRPYYNFGMKQDVRCRFLVSVRKETTRRETWEAGLSLIERYFFKKIRGKSA